MVPHAPGTPCAPIRDYDALLERHGLAAARPPFVVGPGRHVVMRRCIDLLWGGVGSAGLSWIGFYERSGDDQMTLVCREPKPACSPIGLHGMCGRGMLDRRPLVIADVRTLGPNYIACDPKDQSELVIPLLAPDGSCDAVLDVDSWDLASFDDRDAAGMTRVLLALGLTSTAAVDLRSLHP